MPASASHSNHQHTFGQVRTFGAEVLYLAFIAVAKVVETQAVMLSIHYFAQLRLETAALGGVQQALKNRILYALSIVYALLCYLPQASSAIYILGIHVVSNQNKHGDLTSITTADMRPNHRGDSVRAEALGHTEPVPRGVFLPDKGA